jgi:dUTP pyrophosphatase
MIEFIPFKRLRPEAIEPTKAHQGDAGWDLYSAENVVLEPGECKKVSTGIAVAIWDGYAGRIAERSGFSTNNLVSIRGKEIDSTYRGDLLVALHNLHPIAPLIVSKGQRIAQLIIYPVCLNPLKEYDELPPSHRGARGFGSSGD